MKQILKLMVQAASGFLAGALCAGLVGFVVFQVLYSPDQAGCDGLFTAIATVLAVILVYPIGVAIGTHLAGRLIHFPKSEAPSD
jgi:hypothetical protein